MLGDDGNQFGAHSALRNPNSALERLFSGVHFGMDEWGERELSQLAADGRRLTWRIAGRLVCAEALRLGTSRAPAKTGTEFRWRLSPECRYAETDWSRSPQFAIRNSKLSRLFSGIQFGMDDWGIWRLNFQPRMNTDEHGWRSGARGKAAEGCRSPKPGGNSERAGEREASWSAPALWRFGTAQPSWRGGVLAERGKLGRNLDGGFLPNAATPKRTGRALRNSQFAIRNGLGFFSGFHFGLDVWGIWRLNLVQAQKPQTIHSVINNCAS